MCLFVVSFTARCVCVVMYSLCDCVLYSLCVVCCIDGYTSSGVFGFYLGLCIVVCSIVVVCV